MEQGERFPRDDSDAIARYLYETSSALMPRTLGVLWVSKCNVILLHLLHFDRPNLPRESA